MSRFCVCPMLNLYASLFCVIVFGLSWLIFMGGKGAGAGEKRRTSMGSRPEKVELVRISEWERFIGPELVLVSIDLFRILFEIEI